MGATQAWSGTPPQSRPDKAAAAAKAILEDAKRGPAMATNVETHISGLGRAQLRTVVQILFTELASRYASEQCDQNA
jgi:hypothetical protein